MEKTLGIISGKWKTVILWYLCSGKKRYGELKHSIMGVSEKMLIQSLRELESDGLISRKAYNEIPPKVEYSMTKKGKSLSPALALLDKWGKKNL